MPDADQQVVYWRLKHDHEFGLTNLHISGDGGNSWQYICTYTLSSDYDANRFRETLGIARMFLSVLNFDLQRHPDNFPAKMIQGFASTQAAHEKKEDEW